MVQWIRFQTTTGEGAELRCHVPLGQKKKNNVEPNKNENRIYQLKKLF